MSWRDNSAPRLVMPGGHLQLVDTGAMVSLRADVISAHDLDTSDDQLTFYVTRSPRYGRLQKRSTHDAPGDTADRPGLYFHHPSLRRCFTPGSKPSCFTNHFYWQDISDHNSCHHPSLVTLDFLPSSGLTPWFLARHRFF